MMRLHPYHAERILARAPVFSRMSDIVASHHEQPDGKGYFRGLKDDAVPCAARILAAADRFDELTHERPGRKPLSADVAFEVMNRDAHTVFYDDVLHALHECIEHAPPEESTRFSLTPAAVCEPARVWPAGLTDREVDVLRILATGASRQEMAKGLSVSEHTVRHHLEHIYGKIGVHTRVEATLFSIEHGLLS